VPSPLSESNGVASLERSSALTSVDNARDNAKMDGSVDCPTSELEYHAGTPLGGKYVERPARRSQMYLSTV